MLKTRLATRSWPERVAVAVILTAALLLTHAPAAKADVSKSGTKYCNTTVPYTRAYSTGTTKHYPPGSGYAVYYNGGTWRVTEQNASYGTGGYWWVTTNGSLNDPGTYAGCRAYG